MAFDPSKDVLIWQTPEMSEDKMFINIKKYGTYPAKVEFVRHVPTAQEPNAVRSAGRLSLKDWAFLAKWASQVEALMQQHGQQQDRQQNQYNQGSNPVPQY